MTDDQIMDHSRFIALAEAFGGDIGRWPGAEQPAARALLAEDASMSRVLHDASALDDILATSPEPMFSGVLRERLMAQAPKPTLRPRGVVRWLSGAGLAAACACGVMLGATYSDRLIGDPADNAVATASTSFDGQADILGLGET